MPLLLKPVEASRGARWVRDALTLYLRRPLAFSMMFVVYLCAALLALMLLPWVGGWVFLGSLPLLSLGFMVASQSALLDGPVHPGQFVEPLRGTPAKRRALLLLCLIFGACGMGILTLVDIVSHHAGQRVMELMTSGQANPEELAAIAEEPGLARAQLIGTLLFALLSVPFWHAPALVHWGSQGVGQALFSSTLALWRCKGAFLVYGAVWMAAMLGFSFVVSLLLALAGAVHLVPLVAGAAMLMFQTLFCVSLIFTFNDSFGGAQARPEEFTPPA